MKKIYIHLIFVLLLNNIIVKAQNSENFKLTSKDGSTILSINIGQRILWSLNHRGEKVIAPSAVSLELDGNVVLGKDAKIISSEKRTVDTIISAINYIKSVIHNRYEQITINFEGDYGIIFRLYNDAVAYRFFTQKKGEIIIENEEANFNFTNDYRALIPYLTDYRDGKIFNASFESQYEDQTISGFKKDSLAFLPLLVDIGNGKKVEILEADLEDYPGMFLDLNDTGLGFKGVYAPYPLKEVQVGINYIPTERADYIAKTKGTRKYPWRIIVVSDRDKELLNNDIIQELASPSRIKNESWIKPGQVAWDWWNARNISHVDFRAGINTATYKYYIDFASSNNIKYIIMDGGWSDSRDLTKTKPGINLPEIIEYGKRKNVDVILWASWYNILQQMDEVFQLYSKMGIKGFKIDFIDRDDQKAVASTYEIAKKAAEYHLLIDYHGIFKPTGLQKTYPNVIGYEGVQGLEYAKWSRNNVPRYDVTIPYIRMIAGPMDYTPGAMRNANKDNFRAINSNPMSQGTRCHQLAMYIIFYAPLQMLSDNPTTYMKEQECTNFITKVPTTFDETIPLEGKVGEYVAIARRKGHTWYIGLMTNWNGRDLTINFSFLGKGKYKAVIFKDGINADRDAEDYSREVKEISSGDSLNISLSSGGGWAARLERTD